MTTDVNHCSEWRALASCHLDGELDELQEARLENHLSRCAECAAWVDEVAEIARRLRDADSMAPASTFVPSTSRRRAMRATGVAATAASAAAAVLAAFALGLPTRVPLLSPGGTMHAVAKLPCVSCVKRQLLKTALATALPAAAPVHVSNPALDPDSAAR